MVTAGHLHHAVGVVYDTDDGPRFASDASVDELGVLMRSSQSDEHAVILDISEYIGSHIAFDYISEADGCYWSVQNVHQGGPAPEGLRRLHPGRTHMPSTGAEQIRQKARSASASTMAYVQNEPVKAMLIAAASGALLMGLIALLARPSRD